MSTVIWDDLPECLLTNIYSKILFNQPIILLNEILLKKLDPNDFKITQIKKYSPFTLSNNLIEIDKKQMAKIGSFIFEPFILLQKIKKAHGFGANLLEALNNFSSNINEKYRNNKKNQLKSYGVVLKLPNQ